MNKRLRPNHKLTFICFGMLFLALEFLLWSICGVRFWRLSDPDYHHNYIVDIIYTVIAFSLMLTAMIIYIVKIYYVIEKDQIVRYGNGLKTYRFNNIVYIDEEYTKKHVDIRFYDNGGYWVNLTDTRNKDLYKVIKEKSPLLTLDEFKAKYPKATM